MDFTPTILKYGYTPLTMSSGLSFSVTSLTRTSQTDANDFLFAGKAKNLTDGINKIMKNDGHLILFSKIVRFFSPRSNPYSLFYENFRDFLGF